MEIVKIIIFLITVTTVLTVTITLKTTTNGITAIKEEEEEEKPPFELPSKRVSRFLAEQRARNPRAAHHCHKNNQICSAYAVAGRNSTCCNNKCMDLWYDRHNCGACKKKCKYTETCCRGQCVDVAFDKRHCGKCNNRCEHKEYCVYGMCNYA